MFLFVHINIFKHVHTDSNVHVYIYICMYIYKLSWGFPWSSQCLNYLLATLLHRKAATKEIRFEKETAVIKTDGSRSNVNLFSVLENKDWKRKIIFSIADLTHTHTHIHIIYICVKVTFY